MYTETKNQMSKLRERHSDFDRPMSAQERADAMSEFYIPVTELLEPRLKTGALIVADNASAADIRPYLDRVRDPDSGYVSFNFLVRESDSMEISCRTGG